MRRAASRRGRRRDDDEQHADGAVLLSYVSSTYDDSSDTGPLPLHKAISSRLHSIRFDSRDSRGLFYFCTYSLQFRGWRGDEGWVPAELLLGRVRNNLLGVHVFVHPVLPQVAPEAASLLTPPRHLTKARLAAVDPHAGSRTPKRIYQTKSPEYILFKKRKEKKKSPRRAVLVHSRNTTRICCTTRGFTEVEKNVKSYYWWYI